MSLATNNEDLQYRRAVHELDDRPAKRTAGNVSMRAPSCPEHRYQAAHASTTVGDCTGCIRDHDRGQHVRRQPACPTCRAEAPAAAPALEADDEPATEGDPTDDPDGRDDDPGDEPDDPQLELAQAAEPARRAARRRSAS